MVFLPSNSLFSLLILLIYEAGALIVDSRHLFLQHLLLTLPLSIFSFISLIVTVKAQSFGVLKLVFVLTLGGLLVSSSHVITVVTHTFCVMSSICVGTICYNIGNLPSLSSSHILWWALRLSSVRILCLCRISGKYIVIHH